LSDHLGSVRGLMSNGGSLPDGLSYGAYGNVINETSPSNGDRYAYTGRERDLEAHLQYNRARWYDPSTGRWITQDPLGFDAGESAEVVGLALDSITLVSPDSPLFFSAP
jgi:RHS repeat-associated protein